jgi:acyl-coenzyme A synthetase/AMP-(fatty) acid ligase
MYRQQNCKTTYKYFVTHAKQLATHFQQQGIVAQQLVLLVQDDGPEWAVSFFALALIGARPVAVSNQLPLEKLQYLRDLTNSTIAIGQDLGITGVEKYIDIVIESNTPELVNYYQWSLNEPTAYFTTSGTTGSMKLVEHSHNNFKSVLARIKGQLNLDPGSTVLCTAKMCFVWGLGINVLLPMLTGTTHILIGSDLELRNLSELVNKQSVSHMITGPYSLGIMLRSPRTKFLPNLKKIIIGGEPCNPLIVKEFRDKFGIPVSNAYGLTETLFTVLFESGNDFQPNRLGSTLSDVQVKVINDQGQICLPNQHGRLMIQSDSQFLGYYKDEQATRETLYQDWILTNDIVYQDNCNDIYFVERRGQSRKLRGQWINLLDVENLIMQLPNVKDCVAEFYDAGIQASVVIDDCVDENFIKTTLNKTTSNPNLVPEKINFVSSIPRTVTNKKIRKQSVYA